MGPPISLYFIRKRRPRGRRFWLGRRDSNARDDGVKVRCLTAWRRPSIKGLIFKVPTAEITMGTLDSIWGGGWDLNPRSSEPQSDALGQLRYIHHTGCYAPMVRQEGLEPPTLCLEGRCSIQLSYWRKIGADEGNRTPLSSLEGWHSTNELHPHNARIIIAK